MRRLAHTTHEDGHSPPRSCMFLSSSSSYSSNGTRSYTEGSHADRADVGLVPSHDEHEPHRMWGEANPELARAVTASSVEGEDCRLLLRDFNDWGMREDNGGANPDELQYMGGTPTLDSMVSHTKVDTCLPIHVEAWHTQPLVATGRKNVSWANITLAEEEDVLEGMGGKELAYICDSPATMGSSLSERFPANAVPAAEYRDVISKTSHRVLAGYNRLKTGVQQRVYRRYYNSWLSFALTRGSGSKGTQTAFSGHGDRGRNMKAGIDGSRRDDGMQQLSEGAGSCCCGAPAGDGATYCVKCGGLSQVAGLGVSSFAACEPGTMDDGVHGWPHRPFSYPEPLESVEGIAACSRPAPLVCDAVASDVPPRKSLRNGLAPLPETSLPSVVDNPLRVKRM